jgi:hypothetical protein
VGFEGRAVVGRMKAAMSAVGKTSGKVDKPHPPATLGDGKRYSCENCVKYIYLVGDVL